MKLVDFHNCLCVTNAPLAKDSLNDKHVTHTTTCMMKQTCGSIHVKTYNNMYDETNMWVNSCKNITTCMMKQTCGSIHVKTYNNMYDKTNMWVNSCKNPHFKNKQTKKYISTGQSSQDQACIFV